MIRGAVFRGTSLVESLGCPSTASKSELLFKDAVEKELGIPFRKHYPPWLLNMTGYGMELDMYNEEHALAIEYDGPHHYVFPNQYHKSVAEFEALRARDALKDRLCAAKEVRLIRVRASHLTAELESLRAQLSDIGWPQVV